MRLLLDHGAEPNVRFDPGSRSAPLIAAARQGDIETVRLLLDRGPDIHVRMITGSNALDCAQQELQSRTYYPPYAHVRRNEFAATVRLLRRAGLRDPPPSMRVTPEPPDMRQYAVWRERTVAIYRANGWRPSDKPAGARCVRISARRTRSRGQARAGIEYAPRRAVGACRRSALSRSPGGPVRAEVLSVGTELLLGQIVDTNAAYLARILSELGISVYRRVTVGDNMERLVAALRQSLADADVVLTIGGLGPTMDDITRDGLAAAFGDTLHRDDVIAERLRSFFTSRGMSVLESNLRQALVPEHGRALDNPHGTAPGLLFEKGGKLGIALPGPPNEFIPMVDEQVLPILRARTGSIGTIHSRVLRIAGIGESAVEDRVKDLMQDANPTVAPYAKLGEVHLRVTARADTAAESERLIAERAALVVERLGTAVYGEDEETLEMATVRALADRGLTVATAESCTGGLVAKRITDVPGSSAVFPGGVVAYSNEAKTDLVAVPDDLIARVGAVSREVGEALAEGARQRFSADYGIGITGVAGPDGGTAEKPVGLVYIALAFEGGCDVERASFIGARSVVRHRASQTALNMLRLHALAR